MASSPLARRIARERGIDVAQVTGTGPGGRIIERDVMGYAAALEAGAAPTAAEASGGVERVELSRMRQAIARVTSRSMQEAPHFYVTSEVNMGETEHLRRELNSALEQRKTRVSVNDFIIKACAMALAVHPTVNATFQGDGLALHTSVNMGIAIDLEGRGLIIPTLFGCERRSLEEVAEGSRDLVERAKSDGLRPEELSGSTFTISNLGSLDVESFSAIIYQPNSAVLAVGAIKERPVVEQGRIVAARMMKMTLSVDHRVTDGAGAARFLREVKRRLEHPRRHAGVGGPGPSGRRGWRSRPDGRRGSDAHDVVAGVDGDDGAGDAAGEVAGEVEGGLGDVVVGDVAGEWGALQGGALHVPIAGDDA